MKHSFGTPWSRHGAPGSGAPGQTPRQWATTPLACGVTVLALVVGGLVALAAPAPAAQNVPGLIPGSTTTTGKPGSATPPAPPSPTTTVPPWDATPTEVAAPGTAPTPPASPTAKAPQSSTTPGFDPAKSVLVEAETTPTKGVYDNPDGTQTAKISSGPVRFTYDDRICVEIYGACLLRGGAQYAVCRYRDFFRPKL